MSPTESVVRVVLPLLRLIEGTGDFLVAMLRVVVVVNEVVSSFDVVDASNVEVLIELLVDGVEVGGCSEVEGSYVVDLRVVDVVVAGSSVVVCLSVVVRLNVVVCLSVVVGFTEDAVDC